MATKAPENLIAETMYMLIKPYHLAGKRRVKEASKPSKPKPKGTGMNLKDAVFEVMEAAREHSSSGGTIIFGQRRFYYAVRRLIQPLTKSVLKYSYFQKLVQRYQTEHGPIEGHYFEPRGTLYEPHTDTEVGLGTREVAEYQFPEYVFNKILFVEKAGQWPLLKAAKLGERYDMAIVAGEGFASEAARVLFDKAEKDKDYQLFVLHDADDSGYEIARTLQEATERMPGYSVDVKDLGFKVQDAIDVGVEPEEYIRKAALPQALKMNGVEREHFVGTPFTYVEDGKTKTAWRCWRYELDAMTSTQAIEYIEKQLEEAGVRPKVVPPADELPGLAEEIYRREADKWTDAALEEVLGWKALKEEISSELMEAFKLKNAHRYIDARFKKNDALSWRSALKNVLNAIHNAKHTFSFTASVKEKVIEALAENKDEEEEA